MISALNLLWIVPVSMLFGMWVAAMFAAGDAGDDQFSEHRKGGNKK